MFHIKLVASRSPNVLKICINKRNVSTSFRKDYKGFLDRVISNKCDGKILYNTINEHVREIVIDNPAKRGSLSGFMMNQLADIGDEILYGKDKHPFAIIIRGTGDSFCSGMNLSLSNNELNTTETGMQMCDFMTDLLNSLKASSSIIVSLVNGPALGGGAEVVTASDFRIMLSTTYIQFYHARRSLSPGWGK